MCSVQPIAMADHFTPGLKTRPAVHVGSQTMRFFRGDPKEQAWEGLHLAAAFDGDVAVVRNLDPHYLDYWTSLVGRARIVDAAGRNHGQFLTQAILDSPKTVERIKQAMEPDATLMVFFPTPLERDLAERLGIPLHGSPEISGAYGTKSGIRWLAEDAGIPMPPGFVCSTYDEVREAVAVLGRRFDAVAIKHDLSTGGGWSRKWDTRRDADLRSALDHVADGRFGDGHDLDVVEGWMKSKAILCAHIEIPAKSEPVVCAGWEQIIDADGMSYIGAGPLQLSPGARDSFLTGVRALSEALRRQGAVGSFAPDFLVAADHETRAEPDTCVLLELNARVPATAFPLEIVKRVSGTIGTGFCARHVNLAQPVAFPEIAAALRAAGLLLDGGASAPRGIVPYNVGLLPWQLFDVVAIGSCWEEATRIIERVDDVLGGVAPALSA